MDYTFEAVVVKDGEGYSVSFPQIEDAFTFGTTREEAIRRAAEVLKLILSERIEEGTEIPPMERMAEVVSVNVEITGDDIRRSACMTMDQAAEELGVSSSRVSQLASAGKLQVVAFGKKRMVTIASVMARKENPPAAHRPRKAAST